MIYAILFLIPHIFVAPPSDTDFEKQWSLLNVGQEVNGFSGVAGADIDVLPVWEQQKGRRQVVIALIGAGVNDHIEFADRLLPGYVAPLAGGDPYSTLDTAQNGTRAAGIIAAARDNGIGIAGINDNALIVPVRVSNGIQITPESVAQGLNWAVDQGVDIALILVQLNSFNQTLADAVANAADHDVLVICPAGHAGTDDVAFPGSLPDCLAVAATDSRDEQADFSNSGPQVDLAAPGEWIWSTTAAGNYGHVDEGNTFLAAAHVAGVASLLKSSSRQLSAQEIRNILESSADDLGLTGWDEIFGHGRVNAHAALMVPTLPLLHFELVTSPPDEIPPLQVVTFQVRISDGTGILSPTSAELIYRTAPGPFTGSTRLQYQGGGLFEAALPAVPCGTTLEYYLIASAFSGLSATEPPNAPFEWFSAVVNPDVPLFIDDFEEDRGWTSTTSGIGTTGTWVRVDPVGTTLGSDQAQPEFDRTEDHGTQCYLTGQHFPGSATGSNDVDLGPVILESPTTDLGTREEIEIRFASWLFTSSGRPDPIEVSISTDNGVTWMEALTIPATNGWEAHSIALSEIDGAIGSLLRVRFTISDIPSDSLTEAGIDEFGVYSVDCNPLVGDANGDGIVNLRDLDILEGCLVGPAFPSLTSCAPVDLNGDDRVDLRDVARFARGFLASN